jgi:predicted small lipoprotein YifL
MILRLACLFAVMFAVAACGRAGAPLVPAPGVLVMPQDAKSAQPAKDDDFILDPLL